MNDTKNANGGGWKNPALSVLWAIVVLMLGWMYSDASATRADQGKMIQTLSERVATQEEATRNIRESLVRIEAGVNEIRRNGK